eukprot:9843018-Heterocapsa_arctica.AAC.1
MQVQLLKRKWQTPESEWTRPPRAPPLTVCESFAHGGCTNWGTSTLKLANLQGSARICKCNVFKLAGNLRGSA